ncbi:MAG: class B sortase [Lachnospiraceae bacterium]|nr:class B sortase [Lachnospiraceae bacterium]
MIFDQNKISKKRLIPAAILLFALLLLTGWVFKERLLNRRMEQTVTAQNKNQQKEAEANPDIMLPEYRELYEQNHDLIGWLSIEDTVIDYPVMQTPEDEEYYLHLDFYKEKNENGSLIMDTDSQVGIGTAKKKYRNGIKPSTNLIIHGHNMQSGQMFGDLGKYESKEYGMAHNIIHFDSLYEKREYELIAVFYSKVFYEKEDMFKYYQFFQADTREEFKTWYRNIKQMSLYDTGVTAKFGDEFITLSTCSYHVEDGRFVVIGKRIS